MFTCSICAETFVGEHQDSTHATLCGHVFHHHCLVKWLERSSTCPHCRTVVSRDDLIKLFLQVDPNARVVWCKKIEEQLDSIKNKLKFVRENEKNYTCSIFTLETQLKQVYEQKQLGDKKIQSLTTSCKSLEKQNTSILERFTTLVNDNNIVSDQKRNVEAQLQLEKSRTKSLNKNLYEIQSKNAEVIDKLRSEIADLKSEKAYFKSKCNSLEGRNDNTPSTSKSTVESIESNFHQINHETKVLYGNDPNLKWSPTNFLYGCVFLIINDHTSFEDICNDMSMSKLSIIEHGGSVDPIYSLRITHILCATQNHYLVQRGMKDGKRCVTDYWLSDVITKEIMCPPWLALHFPLPYRVETNLPCLHYQIAVANFDVNKYQLVKTMIELTGACVVDEVSSNTDVVVSFKLEGELVDSALELNIPVVNVQWLNDIIFGAQIGIHNPKRMNYQQFDLIDHFSVNYEMVSHLMDAWKHPVIYLKNKEVYDLTIDDLTIPKPKKLKTENESPELIDLVDNDEDIVITYISSNGNKNSPVVSFCGFSSEEEFQLKQIVITLGGNLSDIFSDGTHLIMKTPVKSTLFLLSLSSVTYIVNESWLTDSKSASTFINELDYSVGDVYDELNAVVCNVPTILSIPTRKVLFKNKRFFITPGNKSPSVSCLEKMIRSARGIIECEIRGAKSIDNLPPNSYFIIACKEDLFVVADLIKFYRDKVVFSADFIIHSIMQQRLMFDYAISI